VSSPVVAPREKAQVGQVNREDERHLGTALRLAARGRYRVAPNPRVGAVLVRAGAVVGSGYHHQVGGAHAEVEALAAAGEQARGATLYCTLEPCAHHGRTPPCVDAVIAAGVARVVACHGDPDPRTAGRGFAALRAAGIEVEVGALAAEAARLNFGFLVSRLLNRPAVTLKWAMSLDGKIATASGESRWISSPASRRWSLQLREEHDAILVGVGTILADDPLLDRRLGLAGRPNLRIVLDRRLRTPAGARLFSSPGPVLIFTEAEVAGDSAPAAGALAERGAEVVALPAVEPTAVLASLAARGVQTLLVEGGSAIHASFAAAGCFDRTAVCCAPLLVGGDGARGPLGGAGFGALAQSPRLENLVSRRRGADLILTAERSGCLPELLSKLAV